jgi:hypothetical protein
VPEHELTLVGSTRIEPVTSTVSRCRARALTIELPSSSWAAAIGVSPDFPALALVPPLSVGTLWGQAWGQLRTAIFAVTKGEADSHDQLGRRTAHSCCGR